MGIQGGEDVQQGNSWRTWQARWWLADQALPHLRVRYTVQHRVPAQEKKPQNLWLKKPVGVAAVGETPSLRGKFVGETHRVLE